MGSFRDLVRSRRGPSGRIDEFELGLAVEPAPDGRIQAYELSVIYAKVAHNLLSRLFDFNSILSHSWNCSQVTIKPLCGFRSMRKRSINPLDMRLFLLGTLSDTSDPKYLWEEELKPIAEYLYGLLSRPENSASS